MKEQEKNNINATVKIFTGFDVNKKIKGDNLNAYIKWCIELYKIKIYKQQLYFYDENHYSNDDHKLKRIITINADTYGTILKAKDIKDIFSVFERIAPIIEKEKIDLIKLRNGFISDGKYFEKIEEIKELDGEDFTPLYLDIEYTKDLKHLSDETIKTVDDFFNFISDNDEELKSYLYEIIGHTLLINGKPQKSFFLIGTGKNGKSTFSEMVGNFSGNNASYIDISDMHDKTTAYNINNKLVNIADDIQDYTKEDRRIFKSLVTGNTIGARLIYSPKVVNISNYATLIFSCNKLPNFNLEDSGEMRRISIIPFKKELKDSEINPQLPNLLKTDEAKSYLLYQGLKGIERIKKNNYNMSECKKVKDELKEHILENNTIIQYLEHTDNDITDIKTMNVYNGYKQFCEYNKHKPLTFNSFSKQIQKLGYKISRKQCENFRYKVYEKQKEPKIINLSEINKL